MKNDETWCTISFATVLSEYANNCKFVEFKLLQTKGGPFGLVVCYNLYGLACIFHAIIILNNLLFFVLEF